MDKLIQFKVEVTENEEGGTHNIFIQISNKFFSYGTLYYE